MTTSPPRHVQPILVDLSDFRPSPNQWAFLDDHRSRIKGLIGGLGAGKTRTGAEAFVDLVLANPGCMTLMAGPTHEMTRDLCIPAFEAAMPAGFILRYRKSEKVYVLRGGRLVKHGSADNPTSLEGKNLAAFWADEARYWPLSSWKNLIARLREARARRLQGVVTTTPGPGWLASEFDAMHPGRTTYRVSTRENEKNLAPGYIDDLCRSYSKKQIEALIEGKFTTFVGCVYEEFDDRLHFVPWTFLPSHRTGIVVDFGVASPSVAFWQQIASPHYLPDGRVMPAGSVVVYDELHPDNTPTVRLARQVADRLGWTKMGDEWRPGTRLDAIYCDPAGNARSQETGIPSVQIFRDQFPGVDIRWISDPTSRWIPNGVALLQGMIKPADGGPPRFYISNALRDGGRRGLAKALKSYAYPEARGGRIVSDIPVKDGVYDHAADCARYLAMNIERDEAAGKRPARIRSVIGGVS